MPTRLRNLILLLLALFLIAPMACSSSDDDATAAPTAFTSPVDGKTYCPWVNTPHEVDDGCGNPVTRYPAAPFPIPTDQPIREPGMSGTDYALLGALFGYGLGHHSYFYSEPYYYRHIGPAYTRYPGYVAYGYGHRPLTRYSSVNVYHTTVINHVDSRYAAQEKTFAADPKTGAYKTANGKTYTGATAPKTAFAGTNVTPRGPAGDATTNKATTPSTGTKTTPKTSPSTGTSGKSGYGSGSRSSGGRSSGGRSSGGGHR